MVEKTKISDIAKAQQLFTVPVAKVIAQEVTSMQEGCPSSLIYKLSVLRADDLYPARDSNRQNEERQGSQDQTDDLLRNSVVINASDYASLLYNPMIPTEMIEYYRDWEGTFDTINTKGNITAKPVSFGSFDSLVIAGYRFEAGKIIFYQIVGKAISMSYFLEEDEFNPGLDTTSDKLLSISTKSYAIKVPAKYYESIKALKGSGVYIWRNGQLTNELVGIHAHSFALSVDRVEVLDRVTEQAYNKERLVFALFNTVK